MYIYTENCIIMHKKGDIKMNKLKFEEKVNELKQKTNTILMLEMWTILGEYGDFANKNVKFYILGFKPVYFKNGRLNKKQTSVEREIAEIEYQITAETTIFYVRHCSQHKCVWQDPLMFAEVDGKVWEIIL